MGQPKNYLNGIFVKKKSGQYGEFFSVGLKKADFIRQLNSMTADERGFVNLVMTSQQADASKYSVYEDNWKPTRGDTHVPGTLNTGTHTGMSDAVIDDSERLPF